MNLMNRQEEECLTLRLERGLHAMGPTSPLNPWKAYLMMQLIQLMIHLNKLMQKMIILEKWLSSSLT